MGSLDSSFDTTPNYDSLPSGADAPSGSRLIEAGVRRAWEETAGELGSLDESIRPVDAWSEAAVEAASRAAPRERGDDFVLLDRIAEGGVGLIYRAEQRSLDRQVAIKKIKDRAISEASRRAFLCESLVTGGLDHPNIVPVYGLGQDEEGEAFLAMKLIEGRTWKEFFREEPQALEKHLRILLSVCSAVRFAHEKHGLIHRDLKLDNVMLGEYGEVMVLDWGLALDLKGGEERPARTLTRKDVHKPSGTVRYMAPEMAEIRARDFGPWTDVFLLGAILHEIITESPPYTADSFWEAMASAITCAPKSYGPEVPEELAAIARGAMRREVGERTRSVRDFQAQLEAFLQHRESIAIHNRSRALLGEAIDRRDFNAFSKAIAIAEQALELWPDNAAAAATRAEARKTFARQAIASEDLSIARGQAEALDPADPERPGLLAQIEGLQLRRRARRSLQSAMAVGLASLTVLIIGGGGLAWSLVHSARLKEAEQAALNQVLFEEAALATEARTREHLAQATRVLGEYRVLASRGMLPLNDPERLIPLLAERLRVEKGLDWLTYSDDARGGLNGARRGVLADKPEAITEYRTRIEGARSRVTEAILHPDGRREVFEETLEDYDPRRRAWYQTGAASRRGVWTVPYNWKPSGAGITFTFGHRDQSGALLGVFTADMRLDAISAFLAELKVAGNGRVYLLDRRQLLGQRGAVLASPFPQIIKTLDAGLKVDPAFKAALAQARPRLAELETGRPLSLSFEHQGRTQAAGFRRFRAEGGLELIIAIIAPRRDALDAAYQDIPWTLLATIALLMITAAVGLSLSLRQRRSAS